MDHETFDRLARVLGTLGSRRAALGALLGTGLAGTLGAALAAQKDRGKQDRRRGKDRSGQQGRRGAGLTAEAADCSSPGPSSNMSGCNFNNRDFTDANLSSSRMVGTRFRGADLCSADLSSSQLRDADFRGFPATGPNAGNPTNLTLADLSSSGCNGVRFNDRTLYCRTRTCNGAIRDDDCPPGVDPEDVCCTDADCGAGDRCADGVCVGCRGDADCALCNACVGGRCEAVPNATVACNGSPLRELGSGTFCPTGQTGVCVDGACDCGDAEYDAAADACRCGEAATARCAERGACCTVGGACYTMFAGVFLSSVCIPCR